MGQHYSQISFSERRRIQDLRDVKVPVSAIAKELGRHRSPTGKSGATSTMPRFATAGARSTKATTARAPRNTHRIGGRGGA
jgi:hypothetical protein